MYEPILPAVWEGSQVILQKSAPDTPSIAGSWCQAFVTGEAGNGNPGGETATDPRRGAVLGAGNMSCLQRSLQVSEVASPSIRGREGSSQVRTWTAFPRSSPRAHSPSQVRTGFLRSEQSVRMTQQGCSPRSDQFSTILPAPLKDIVQPRSQGWGFYHLFLNL